jgi:hypothetical protein
MELILTQNYQGTKSAIVAFETKMDSSTGSPLFNMGAWAKANNILEEIQQGYFSDPPGF